MMPLILEDERLSKILTDFDKRYTGTGYTTKKDNENSVTADMLPEVRIRIHFVPIFLFTLAFRDSKLIDYNIFIAFQEIVSTLHEESL